MRDSLWTIAHSIVIDAPVEEVFAYATEPAHLVRACGLEAMGYRFDRTQQAPSDGHHLRFVSEEVANRFERERCKLAGDVMEVVPHERLVLQVTGMGYCFARAFTVQVTFERLEGVKTRVTVVHTYDWSAGNSPIYYHGAPYLAYFDASLLELAPLWEQVLADGLQDLKAHLEVGIPAGARR